MAGAAFEAAGAVFLGGWSPETMGDYCSGPNHTLPDLWLCAKPTAACRWRISKSASRCRSSRPPGFERLSDTAQILANLEGLDAHAAAVTMRLAALDGGIAMNPVLALARPEIRSLEPYSHAAWLPSMTRLHANEAPWRRAGDATVAGLNRYPEPQPSALVERLAALYEVPAGLVARHPRQR